MKTSFKALLTICGMGLLAGCGDSIENVGAIEESALFPQGVGDPEENGGVNGTPNAAFHTYLTSVLGWMEAPLYDSGEVNSEIITSGIAEDSGGHEIFRHLVECTMAEGSVVWVDTAIGPLDFSGKGIVKGAEIWSTDPLSPDTRKNVIECIAAFINDDTVGVPVGLTGKNINPGSGDYSQLILSEAIWCFTSTSNSMDVYVTPGFDGSCGIDPEAALHKRYCGDESNCGFTYHGLLNGAVDPNNCTEIVAGSGKWICDDKACTETWLNPFVDVPHCVPTQQ